MYKCIAVSSRALCKGDFVGKMAEISKAGFDKIILREKDLSQSEYEALVREILPKIDSNLLVIHTHIGVAKRLNLKQIQFSFADFLRNEADLSGLEIGVSVHSLDEAIKCDKMGAKWIIYGHIFTTECKKGVPPRGLDELAQIAKNVECEVYAIGGINSSNFTLPLGVGADGICMMSEVMQSTAKRL